MTQEWKPIKGYEGKYSVSRDGQVMSHGHFNQHGMIKRNLVLKQMLGSNGYWVVTLRLGKRKTATVHRLIAKAFIPNPERKKTVNHIDGNRLNNSIGNLEWASQRENVLHALAIGLTPVGEMCHSAKLKESDVLQMFKMRQEGISARGIAKSFNVSLGHTFDILGKRRWKHLHE